MKVHSARFDRAPQPRRPWPRYLADDPEHAETIAACESCEHLRRRCCGLRFCGAMPVRTQQALLEAVLNRACPLGRHPGQEGAR